MTETLNKLQHLLENSSLPKSDEVFDYEALAELESYTGVKLPQDLVRVLEIMTPYKQCWYQCFVSGDISEELSPEDDEIDEKRLIFQSWLKIDESYDILLTQIGFNDESGFVIPATNPQGEYDDWAAIHYQKEWVPLMENHYGDHYFINLASELPEELNQYAEYLPKPFEIGFMEHSWGGIEAVQLSYQEWIKLWVNECEVLIPLMEAELKNQESS